MCVWKYIHRSRYSHYIKYCNESRPGFADRKLFELEDSCVLTLNCLGYVYQLLNDLDGAILSYLKVAEILRVQSTRSTEEKQLRQQRLLPSEEDVLKLGFGSMGFPPAFISLFPELVLDEVRQSLIPQEKTNAPGVTYSNQRASKKALRTGMGLSYLVGGTPPGSVKEDNEDDLHSILSNEARAYSNLISLLQKKKHGNFSGGNASSAYSGQSGQPYRSTAGSSGSRSLVFALKTSNETESDDYTLMNASYRLGQIYVQLGQWGRAVEQMEQALRSMWTVYPGGASSGGESSVDDGTDGTYGAGRHEWRKYTRSKPRKKERKFRGGNREAREHTEGADEAEEGKIYYSLALSHAALGDHERAIKYFATSLNYVKERMGSESLGVARILYVQGLCHWRLQDWGKSGLLWGDCLRILLRSRDGAMNTSGTVPSQALDVCGVEERGTTSTFDFQVAVVLYSVAASKCALGHHSDPSTLTCLNDAQSTFSSTNINGDGFFSCYYANILFYQGLVYLKKVSEVPMRLQKVAYSTTLNDLIAATGDEHGTKVSGHISMEGMLLQVMACMNDAFAIYTQHSIFPDAEFHSLTNEKVPVEMSVVPKANRLVVAHIRYVQGQVHHKIGFSDSAMMYYGVALRWYQRLFGKVNIYSASVLKSMGGLCSDVGGTRNDRIAVQCYEDALRYQQDLLGSNHSAVASTLGELAGVCAKLDMFERVLSLYQESLRIYMLNEGKEGKNVGKILLFLGVVNARYGQFERAMDFLQGAIRIRKYLVGYYENVLRVTGKSRSTGEHRNSGINRDEEIKRELHNEEMELSIVSYNIGNVYLKLGELERALSCFEDMLEIRRRHCGAPKNTSELLDVFLNSGHSNEWKTGPSEEDLSTIADALHNCGCCYFFLKQFGKALACYNEALVLKGTLCRLDSVKAGTQNRAMKEGETGEQNTKVVHFSESTGSGFGDSLTYATTLKSIGAVHSKLTNYDMALQHYEIALQIQQSHLGYDHIVVAGTLSDMGHLLRRTHYMPDTAARCYKESLRISKLKLGPDHENVAHLLYNLGYVYDSMHRYNQAVACYSECVRVYGKRYSQGLLYRLLRCRGSNQSGQGEDIKDSISRDISFEEYQSSSDQASDMGENDSRENYHRVLNALEHSTRQAHETGSTVDSDNIFRINFEVLLLRFLEFLSDYIVDPTKNAIRSSVNSSVRSLEQASSNAVMTTRDQVAHQFLYLIQE